MTEIRSYSKRKKSRVNVVLTPFSGTEGLEHKMEIYVGNHENRRTITPIDYFNDEYLVPTLFSPFSYLPANHLGQKYLIKAFVKGGGLSSQAKALTLAIARALLKYYPEMKVSLRKANLLTQDSRVKERKKIGKYKARRSPQFTKR
ncbi:30S ribosomal protein S9 [Mycoplasma suis]|uniref:30S ribosomal protein S9 n=2 Tax=Mycoplasma suis TaxID=57372 RepID=F0QR30_MYCSL|nr:30S ribosomal protein S9 [Mycoplasma suis]ADX97950.1 30S ribosomal protein S9 [Mycoplasma suis str. Illinois]CBZ40446.1 30S ribosomal protein S9 [Mycoplasma suis KI3806]